MVNVGEELLVGADAAQLVAQGLQGFLQPGAGRQRRVPVLYALHTFRRARPSRARPTCCHAHAGALNDGDDEADDVQGVAQRCTPDDLREAAEDGCVVALHGGEEGRQVAPAKGVHDDAHVGSANVQWCVVHRAADGDAVVSGDGAWQVTGGVLDCRTKVRCQVPTKGGSSTRGMTT